MSVVYTRAKLTSISHSHPQIVAVQAAGQAAEKSPAVPEPMIHKTKGKGPTGAFSFRAWDEWGKNSVLHAPFQPEK